MAVPFDTFVGAFLAKIEEYEFIHLTVADKQALCDGYLKRAMTEFKKNSKYDFSGNVDETNRQYTVNVNAEDLDEIVNIVSEGMLVQWLKPYVYKQELLENVLSTKDFSTYSPAELLLRVGNAYKKAQQDYTQMIREYSYNHADLSTLHL